MIDPIWGTVHAAPARLTIAVWRSWRYRRVNGSALMLLHRERFLIGKQEISPSHVRYPVFSGKSPGIQRDAKVAGNARRSGARVLSEATTP